MKLRRKDGERFFRLYYSLLGWANKDLQIFPDPVVIGSMSHQDAIIKLRKAVFGDPMYINTFIEENPRDMGRKDLEMIKSWQEHRLEGTFAVMRHLKDHSIMLTIEDPSLDYGVLGISDSIRMMVGPKLPQIVDAILLPFKDRIIIDGLLRLYPIRLEATAKLELEVAYQEAMVRPGVITSLPAPLVISSQQEKD